MRKRDRWYSNLCLLVPLIVLCGVFITFQASASEPPYRPPYYYSGKCYDELIQKLHSPEISERESAAYYLGDRLRWNYNLGDMPRTFEALKQALGSETSPKVRSNIWMTISNMLRGKSDSASTRLFHEQKDFWLTILADSDDFNAVHQVLFLIGYHKAGWAEASVVAALSFPHEQVKIEACKTVVALKLKAAQPVLRSLLRQPDETGSLHDACARTLGKVGSAASVEDLSNRRNAVKAKGHSAADFDLAIEQIRHRCSPENRR